MYGLISFTLRVNHFYEFQQILDARQSPALGLLDEGIFGACIGPSRGQIGGQALLRKIVYAPLPPAALAVHHLKALAAPGMKWMRDSEQLFGFVRAGCSSHPTPHGNGKRQDPRPVDHRKPKSTLTGLVDPYPCFFSPSGLGR
jgi:hypothetical protein